MGLPDGGDATIRLQPFRAEDQREARALILLGLGEHWGEVREDLNPDADDIAQTYASGYFVVARLRDEIVGTGGFLPRRAGTVQIQRVSVAPEHRRRGVGSRVVAELLRAARARGFRRAILETTESWTDVVAFWRRQGFEPFERRGGDLYFRRDLGPTSPGSTDEARPWHLRAGRRRPATAPGPRTRAAGVPESQGAGVARHRRPE